MSLKSILDKNIPRKADVRKKDNERTFVTTLKSKQNTLFFLPNWLFNKLG